MKEILKIDEQAQEAYIEKDGVRVANTPKVLDMDKIIECEDANVKVNAIFSLLKQMSITVNPGTAVENIEQFLQEKSTPILYEVQK